MTRIGPRLPGVGVRKFKNRNIRIQAKQAEINRILEMEKEGLISPEDARLRIALLEAQIKELEFGVPDGGESDAEIEMPPNQPTALGAPVNSAGLSIEQSPTQVSSSETPNGEGGDSDDGKDREKDKEYGKDDAYSYTANMLKIYHGLT